MEYKKVIKYGLPRSIRGRIRRMPYISAGLLTVLGPILGLMLREISGGEGSILAWETGVVLWALSVLLIPAYAVLAGGVKRAATAEAVLALAILPTGLALLDGGFRLSARLLGTGSTLLIGLALLAGLVTLPFVVRNRGQWFRESLRQGPHRQSLDKATATWDSQFDLEVMESSKLLNRPGCLMRLLPWVGPGLGMLLDNIFGEAEALRIFVYVILLGGYLFIYLPMVALFVRVLELRRLEKELGRPIMLKA
jgi:hypothetical protein